MIVCVALDNLDGSDLTKTLKKTEEILQLDDGTKMVLSHLLLSFLGEERTRDIVAQRKDHRKICDLEFSYLGMTYVIIFTPNSFKEIQYEEDLGIISLVLEEHAEMIKRGTQGVLKNNHQECLVA